MSKRLVSPRLQRSARGQLTQSDLKLMLSYDENTGVFVWLNPLSRRVNAGDSAGSVHARGHIDIRIKGIPYKAHRLAWLYVYGYFPNKILDHINGNPSDNRISNLRECTDSENLKNVKKHADNKTGFKGVYYRKERNTYRASIMANGKKHLLGSYKNPEDAHEAYRNAAKELHGEYARLE